MVIENAFSLLKGRWKRLHYVDVNTIDKLCARITAACVLHNFCILQDDILENIIVAEEHEEHHLPNPNYVESMLFHSYHSITFFFFFFSVVFVGTITFSLLFM